MRARIVGLILLAVLLAPLGAEASSCWLKQSTAVSLGLGPFVDNTDGFTAETALTISQADVRLKKNDAAWAQKGDANACAHEENGYYECAFSTTDTGTAGILKIAVNETGALPVFKDCMVLAPNAYDAMVSGSGVGVRADVQGWLGTAPATPTVGGVPEVDLTHIAGAANNTAAAQLGVNLVAISGDATAADNFEAALDGTGGITISANLAGSVDSCVGCSSAGGVTIDSGQAYVKDATGVIVPILIRDSTTNLGKTGLTSASSGLKIRYCRYDQGNADCSDVTPAAATRGSYTSGGFVEKDAADAQGTYEFGAPTAMLAAGADYVELYISGVSGTLPTKKTIELVDVGLQAMNLKLGTPSGASMSADIAGVKSDSSAIKTKTDPLNMTGANLNAHVAAYGSGLTPVLPGTGAGQLTTTSGEVTVGANNDKTGYTAAVSDKTGFSLATSQSFNTTGSVGSVTGAVGSVTGAVGSVANAPTNWSNTLISSGGYVTAGGTFKRATAGQSFDIIAIDSTGHTAFTPGLTVACTVSKDGGLPAAMGGTVSENGGVGNGGGRYHVSPSAGDLTCETCSFVCTGTGMDPVGYPARTAP